MQDVSAWCAGIFFKTCFGHYHTVEEAATPSLVVLPVMSRNAAELYSHSQQPAAHLTSNDNTLQTGDASFSQWVAPCTVSVLRKQGKGGPR
jgi:hypothetical protein